MSICTTSINKISVYTRQYLTKCRLLVSATYGIRFRRLSPTNAYAAGFTGTSTDWVITCNPNCLRPFSFRAVNATGTQQELLDGGFWSRLYWIRPSASPSSTSSTSTQSSTSTSSSSQSTSTKSSTTASGTSSTTNSSKGGSNSGNSSKDTAIGVGVGVGVGVALLLIGGFFLWRRYHRKLKARYSRPPTVTGSEIEAWPQPSWSYQGGELPAANAPKELSGQPQGPNFHELPSQEHS